MSQGRRRAAQLRNMDLELRRRAMEYMTASDFPAGQTYEGLGLPADFELIPGLSPLQTIATEGASDQFEGMLGQQQQALGRVYGGEAAFAPDPALRERYYQTQVEVPTLRSYREEVLPMIAERYGPGGQRGALYDALGRSSAGMMEALAGMRSQFLRDDERLAMQSNENALQRMYALSAMGGAPMLSPYAALADIGSLERGVSAQQRGELFNRAVMAQPYSDPRWGILSGVLGLNPMPVGSGSSGSAMGSLLQLGGAVLGPASPFTTSTGLGWSMF